MLSRVEHKIMEHLFEQCRGKRTVLIDPETVLTTIATRPRFEITKKQLDIHMKNLVLDGYIDYNQSETKDGVAKYIVTLTTRGEAFQRERDEKVKSRLQDLGWKIVLTIVACIVTSIFWYIGRR